MTKFRDFVTPIPLMLFAVALAICYFAATQRYEINVMNRFVFVRTDRLTGHTEECRHDATNGNLECTDAVEAHDR